MKTEIQKPEYQGMTDKEVADYMNEVNQVGKIPVKDIKMYLSLHGKWANIVDDALNSVDLTKRKTALAFTETLKNFNAIDLQDTNIKQAVINQLDTMIVQGFITEQNKNELLSLENNRQSIGQKLGFGKVTELQVKKARG